MKRKAKELLIIQGEIK